jgi:hypothetical protein
VSVDGLSHLSALVADQELDLFDTQTALAEQGHEAVAPASLRRAAVEYIGWHNGTRRHNTLGYRSPAENWGDRARSRM